MENPNYKNENIERKYLNNIQKKIKLKSSLLELEKYFLELKDRELKDREMKIKREIEELFFKPIIVSRDDIDKFEEKEMKKTRSIKNTWGDWLINYIPEPVTKDVGGFKDKVVRLFNTSTSKPTVYGGGKKLSKPKTQNKINSIRNLFILKKTKRRKKGIIDRITKDRIIRDIWRLFETEEKKRNKEIGEKREINTRLIIDKIIRDIKTLFEQEDYDEYFKPKRVRHFWNNNYIEYESNDDRNKILPLDKYLNKTEPYLRDIIIDLQNSDTW